MTKSIRNQGKNKKKRELRKESFTTSDSEPADVKQIKIDNEGNDV